MQTYPAMALNMVLTTVTGQCIGGRRCDRAKDYIKISLIYGFGLNGIWTAVLVSHIVAVAAACLIGTLELKGQERILSGERGDCINMVH